ncbi:MAG TPA: DUF4349 domain-containing protein [Vicinamibacteria bacterium]|nr:DUF4349 domain-containing protein [Vicinamibacteria bacterium]
MAKRATPWLIGGAVALLVLIGLIAVGVPSLLRARAPAGIIGDRAMPMPEPAAPPATLAPFIEAKAARSQAVAGGAEAAEPPSAAAQYAARKLIRTGQMTLEVASFEQAAARVAAIAESYGGYLAESQASRGAQDRQQGSITLRVPAERFGAAFAALKGLGKVQMENVSTQDITKAYADLETRLSVKRDTAERLREILRGRAARLSDVLEAERELARVTEEIERMEGERRYYDQQVALSTITVALHELQAVVGPSAFAPLRQALRESLEVLSTSMAAMVYVTAFLAPWVAVVLLVWASVRAVRRRRAARAG